MTTYKPKIRTVAELVEPVVVIELTNLVEWLCEQAARFNLTTLLAHADDGVIWGKIEDSRLITSFDALQKEKKPGVRLPPLRLETLQQARLFSDAGELLLWRDGRNQWHARIVRTIRPDETANLTDCIDEPQMLWGTMAEPLDFEFTLMTDGEQGLRHAVPMDVGAAYKNSPKLNTRLLRLHVRHFLHEDEATGVNRINVSRLTKLSVE